MPADYVALVRECFRRARHVQEALDAAINLLVQNIEHYQGKGGRVSATVEGEHGRVLNLLLKAREQPPYVPSWVREAQELDRGYEEVLRNVYGRQGKSSPPA